MLISIPKLQQCVLLLTLMVAMSVLGQSQCPSKCKCIRNDISCGNDTAVLKALQNMTTRMQTLELHDIDLDNEERRRSLKAIFDKQPDMQKLTIRQCKATSRVFQTMNGLTSLNMLYMPSNSISRFDVSDAAHLTKKVAHLMMNNNPLTNILGINKLESLVNLELVGCGLTTSHISNITSQGQLHSIDISNNRLTTIGTRFCSNGCPNLSFLFAKTNKITELSKSFLNDRVWAQLEVLDLHGNMITKIEPFTFGKVAKLTALTLSASPQFTTYGPNTLAGLGNLPEKIDIELSEKTEQVNECAFGDDSMRTGKYTVKLLDGRRIKCDCHLKHLVEEISEHIHELGRCADGSAEINANFDMSRLAANQHCQVTDCRKLVQTTTQGIIDGPTTSTNNLPVIIGGAAAGVILLFALIIVIVCCACKRRKHQNNESSNIYGSSGDKSGGGGGLCCLCCEDTDGGFYAQPRPTRNSQRFSRRKAPIPTLPPPNMDPYGISRQQRSAVNSVSSAVSHNPVFELNPRNGRVSAMSSQTSSTSLPITTPGSTGSFWGPRTPASMQQQMPPTTDEEYMTPDDHRGSRAPPVPAPLISTGVDNRAFNTASLRRQRNSAAAAQQNHHAQPSPLISPGGNAEPMSTFGGMYGPHNRRSIKGQQFQSVVSNNGYMGRQSAENILQAANRNDQYSQSQTSSPVSSQQQPVYPQNSFYSPPQHQPSRYPHQSARENDYETPGRLSNGSGNNLDDRPIGTTV